MKMKKSGDWRREILGDLTVMNAEEVIMLCIFFVSHSKIDRPGE